MQFSLDRLSHNWHFAACAECSSSSRHKHWQVRPWPVESTSWVTSYTGSTFSERVEKMLAFMVRRCLENKAPTYLSDHCTLVTAVSIRHLGPTISQPASAVCTLYSDVSELYSAIGSDGLELTTDWVSFRDLSVLVTLGAPLRRYYSCDINALRYTNFLYYSITLHVLAKKANHCRAIRVEHQSTSCSVNQHWWLVMYTRSRVQSLSDVTQRRIHYFYADMNLHHELFALYFDVATKNEGKGKSAP